MCQPLQYEMMKNKTHKCIACGEDILDKNIIGINKKLLGEKNATYYCLECLADFFGCDVQDILDKIEEFKEEGCKFFS